MGVCMASVTIHGGEGVGSCHCKGTFLCNGPGILVTLWVSLFNYKSEE